MGWAAVQEAGPEKMSRQAVLTKAGMVIGKLSPISLHMACVRLRESSPLCVPHIRFSIVLLNCLIRRTMENLKYRCPRTAQKHSVKKENIVLLMCSAKEGPGAFV